MIRALFVFGLIISMVANVSLASEDDVCSCDGEAALHPVDDILACFTDPRCEEQKLDLAVAMRIKGRSLAEAIKNYLYLSNNMTISPAEQQAYLDKIAANRKRLITIKKLIPFQGYDNLIEPLYLDFDTPEKRYYRHYSSFNIGYEYVGLNELFQTGLPRIGFLHYRRFGQAPALKEGLGYYGIHAFGNMQLTSSAEQATNTSAENNNIQNTMVVTAAVFIPFFHSTINSDRTLSDLTGVLISYGAKKNNTLERVSSRVYTGIRNSFNPETYIDVLFGKTQGLETARMEVRAHLPVYKFVHGSRIFFGGTLNMATPWSEATNDPDVIRFYLEWNADFGKIIEGIKSAFGA